MTDFLPTQEPGPGPTDAPLATYQSYSAFTTSTYDFTTTITRVAYNPEGTVAPSPVIETKTSKTTSIGYSVVNLPLLYTGPFPAPPLGTLFTTAGEILATQSSQPSPTPTVPIASSFPTPTSPLTASGSANSNGGNSNGQDSLPSQPIAAPAPAATGASSQGQAQGTTNSNQGNQNGIGNGGGSNDGSQSTQAGGQQQSSNGSNEQSTANGNNQGASTGVSAIGNSQGSGGGAGSGATSTQSIATTTSGTSQPRPTTAPSATSNSAASSVLDSISNASASASAESVSASQESVSASNAAASASLASASATNAAQSSSASLASASAASAASSASALSASASPLSASASQASASVVASSFSLTSTAPKPTSTFPGGISPPIGTNFATTGLSGGQIAGIVLGSFFGLLLLLLAFLLLVRRKRRVAGTARAAGTRRNFSDKWASGFSRKGKYAELGAGAGVGAGLLAAGAGGRGSTHSNEWEEDRLSGGNGSGFFVVGGKRAGSGQSGGGYGSVRQKDNGGPSNSTSAAAEGLAGIAAGIAAAFGAKKARKSPGKGRTSDHQTVPTSSQEADMADEMDVDRMLASDEDNEMNGESRGLMSFGDLGDSSEMTQAGPSGWTRNPIGGGGYSGWDEAVAGGGAAALGAGAMYAASRDKQKQDVDEEGNDNFQTARDTGDPSAYSRRGGTEGAWFAGGVAASAAGRSTGGDSSAAAGTSAAGQNMSSNSGAGSGTATGSGSKSGSGSGSGDIASSRSTGARTDTQGSTSAGDSSTTDGPIQTYGNVDSSRQSRIPSFTGGFGDGDLGLAERQREGGRFNEEALLGAGIAGAGLGAFAAGHRDSGVSSTGSDAGQDEQYNRYISKNTPLLGPDANQGKEQQQQHNRLPTIQSVGEFGERTSAGSQSQSGTGPTDSSGTKSGCGSGRSVPIYGSSAGPSNPALAIFSTPIGSPEVGQDPFQDQGSLQDIPDNESSAQHGSQELASTAATGAGVGFLGGLIPSLTRWTRFDDPQDSRQANNEEGHVRPGEAGHERGQASETAEIHSQRASVYNTGSIMTHDGISPSLRRGHDSGDGFESGSKSAPSPSKSQEQEQDIYAPDEEEAQEDPFDEEDAAAEGYAASVSNLSQNVSSGNSRSASRRSGQTTSTGLSRGTTSGTNSNSQSGTGSSRRNESSSGGSTGAASYDPSHLARQSKSSTRGGVSGSGSLSSRSVTRGGSSSRRRRGGETDGDNGSSLTGTGESDGQSSRATAGGGEDLARLSLDPGLERVQEGQEDLFPSSDFYPSESLGAAVRRRAEREAQETGDERNINTPRSHPISLVPGASHWRQSPRVESASQRANANLGQGGSSYQRPDLRDSFSPPEASTSSPRRTRLPDPEEARTEATEPDDQEGGEDGDSSRDRSGIWPSFLRF